MKAFLGLPLDHARYPYVFFDATYLHGRLEQNMQVVSRAVVLRSATAMRKPKGYKALGYREVLGIAVGRQLGGGLLLPFHRLSQERGLTGSRLVISNAYLGHMATIRRMLQVRC